jgi:protein tyrosine/serine phosphatase
MAVLVAVAGMALAGALVWHHASKPYHFEVVTPGVLYRSGTLQPADLDKVLQEFGIRTVVNLRAMHTAAPPDWYRQEREVCKERGVRLVDIPMEADRAPTDAQVAAWLALLEDSRGLPILVHCQRGVVRTGMMVAIYEMEYLGKDPRRSLEELPAFGHDLGKDDYRFFRDLILNYTPRRKQAAAP